MGNKQSTRNSSNVDQGDINYGRKNNVEIFTNSEKD